MKIELTNKRGKLYLKVGGLVLVVVLSLLAYFAFAESYSVKNEYSNFSLVDLTDPDPANISLKRNYTFINISVVNISNLHSLIVNWNGTNVTVDDPSLVLALDFNNNTRDRSRYGNDG